MVSWAGKLRQAVEKDPSTTDTPQGPQEDVVIIVSTGLEYYLEKKLKAVPCQFLLDSGVQVSLVHH